LVPDQGSEIFCVSIYDLSWHLSNIEGLRERSNALAEPVFGNVLNRATQCGDATLSRYSLGEVAFARRAKAWAKASHLIDCSAKQPER
jgi:hypothetical protein